MLGGASLIVRRAGFSLYRRSCCGHHPCPGAAAPARVLALALQQRAMAASAAAAAGGEAAVAAEAPCRIAVGQMTSVGDQAANFETCRRLAEEAAGRGCSMLFLPECFSFIGTSQPESLSKAEPLDGPAMARYRQLARDTSLWLSLGGFQETGPDPQHLYNCHVVLDPTGGTAAWYRKVHLFDVDVPNGPVLMESRTTAPGSKLVVCPSPAGVLGLTICYDLRFPELYQKMAWEMGAQLLLVPSAFTKVTGAAHWEVLLRARAIECQAYVIAAAQAGRHNDKRESYGHSLVIDPWGDVVARFEPDPLATGIITADIDLGLLRRVREKMPIQEHRLTGRRHYLGAE
ncbi:MAG: carbon-nitrogen hydrolase [Monoraphidium minutum]|nr:MAG: carbon-nitrogen hydrolase [Monoraphidium minutum]